MTALLTTREREVLNLFMDGLSDTNIARKLGISLTRVAQLKKTALGKLYRAYLESEGKVETACLKDEFLPYLRTAKYNSASNSGRSSIQALRKETSCVRKII